MKKRRFELVEGTSSKFWEVATRGAVVEVRFGRIGTDGQTTEKKLASPAAAEAEAEKLVREKTRKGYRDAGAADAKAAPPPEPRATAKKPAAPARAGTAPAAVAAKKKQESKEKLAARSAIMPVPGEDDPRPGSFAFTAEEDALFARGWPHLRVLTDESVPEKAAIKLAMKALEGVDPYLPTILPRDVARRVLIGFAKKGRTDRAVAASGAASDREVDAALLAEIVGAPLVTETYVFRLREIVFLLEAFLGTEVVVEAIVAWCARALADTKVWGDKYFVDHDNANYRRVLFALGWMRLRMPAARWRALVAPFAKDNPKLPLYSSTLRQLLDDQSELDGEHVAYALDFAAQRRDPGPLRAHLAKWPTEWPHAERVYVLGSASLLDADLSRLPRLPKWWQERVVAEIGTIAAPGTVRVMAALLPSRSAGAAASAWLERHRAWVERVALPALEARPQDRALVTAARAALGRASAPSATPEQLEGELRSLLRGVPDALRKCAGDRARELGMLRTTFARYCEIRAAQGDITPEAYFTHQFIDMDFDGVDRDTHARWMDLALEACS